MSTLSVNTVKSLGTGAPVFQNSTGTEKGQLAKAWIDFNSIDGSIRDSFNISSITDTGTEFYTITFATAMSNDDYCCVAAGSGAYGSLLTSSNYNRYAEVAPKDSSSCSVACYAPDNGTLVSISYVGVVIFGD